MRGLCVCVYKPAFVNVRMFVDARARVDSRRGWGGGGGVVSS